MNRHAEHLGRAWRVCRWGVERTAADMAGRQRVAAWLARFRALNPGLLDEWNAIVEGRAEMRATQLRSTADYFALAPEDRAWWRGMIQSHPFAALLHGVDNRTRRAVKLKVLGNGCDN